MFEQDYSNQVCFDCFQALPEFASMNNGIYLCSNCAGLHRTLGAVTSNVKSLTLDTWTIKQLSVMALGGNQNLREYFDFFDLNELSAHKRYNTRAAQYYR